MSPAIELHWALIYPNPYRVEEMMPPEEHALEISIHSQVPAGASTGASAAVSVALIGALDALTPGRLTPHEVAYAAHRVETRRLKLQSGIQDQLCAAYVSLNYIEMFASGLPAHY
jgi:D-glycero-alpha-D-manno-heptose-7-phosphate kinase